MFRTPSFKKVSYKSVYTSHNISISSISQTFHELLRKGQKGEKNAPPPPLQPEEHKQNQMPRGVGTAQWLECQNHDHMVVGLSPAGVLGEIFFSGVNISCWLFVWYLLHLCVTTVTHKRSQSFCQKCKWQVTATHTCTLHVWLQMKWHMNWCRVSLAAARKQQMSTSVDS